MRHDEALALVRGGVGPGGVWADLGAGTGTFTRALRELIGPGGTVWAVDRRDEAVRALNRTGSSPGAEVRVLRADFTDPLDLPPLDGALMANALHFVEDQEAVIRRIARALRPGGRLLLVEYDRSRGNRWVPYPVPPDRFEALCEAAGLTPPEEIGRRSSAYWREMYAAVALRPR